MTQSTPGGGMHLLRRGWPVIVVALAIALFVIIDQRGQRGQPSAPAPPRGQQAQQPPGPPLPANLDANGDGQVTALDALCVLRTVGNYPATSTCPSPLTWPGVRGDRQVDATDALCILRAVGGFEQSVQCAPAAAGAQSGGAGQQAFIKVEPGEVRVQPGGTATFTLEATAPAGGMGAVTLDIEYDQAVIRLTECRPGPSFPSALCNTSAREGAVRFTDTSVNGVRGAAQVAAFTLQPAEGAAAGSTPLIVRVVTLTDPEGRPLFFATTGGTVRIGG